MLARVEAQARLTLPVLLSLTLAMIAVVPFQAPGFADVSPMLVLGSIYYWAIYRPQVLPLVAVFGIGLFEDILAGAPLGVSSFAYLVSFAVAAGQRRFFIGKNFAVVWWGFAMVAGAVEGVRWLLISGFAGAVIDPTPGLFAYGSTVAVYPVLTLLFLITQRVLPQPAEYA